MLKHGQQNKLLSMLNNFQKSLQYVLESEGLFTDNPLDAGGATMKGITLETYRIYKKNTHLTPNDLEQISDMDVSTIYLNQYWNACRCSDLPSGIDYCVFDMAINSGTGMSVKLLQKSVGTDIDGVFGSITLALTKGKDQLGLIRAFSDQKESFYRNIVAKRPSQSVFINGWLARINDVQERAIKMITQSS